MSTAAYILIALLVITLIALGVFYYLGKKAEKRQAEQQSQIDAMKQTVSMLIIDKKMLKMKESGLPEMVTKSVPWYLRWQKVPIVKAKIGPRIMILMADQEIFPLIPVKKEVKGTISGIYMTGVKGVRGPLEVPKKLSTWEKIKSKFTKTK
ncbi:MAG: hypothetical protein MJ097_08130 [Dorea sp.]|nr:hypothetical protein [Dorea sp.]